MPALLVFLLLIGTWRDAVVVTDGERVRFERSVDILGSFDITGGNGICFEGGCLEIRPKILKRRQPA